MDLLNKDVTGPLHPEGTSPSRCEGHYFSENGADPFESYAALTAWYEKRRRFHNLLVRSWIRDGADYKDTAEPFDDSMPLDLTHGDISVNNLWLLDWQFSGLYPKWFEYACIMAYERGEPKALLGWLALDPLMAGWFESQLQFMRNNLLDITRVEYDDYE
ncbi:hypothetical protein DXG03_002346 [Asterophora parasitica]|uniref:Aminoglycoside phosphotransferase domain-containing protein n=1 Tax=Asterophora parasitica TaxID=117018 RepID=A0A9P7FX17_9AGAR|nr:hypothetical protein DXG03_002346 [Asterophora parasitica]